MKKLARETELFEQAPVPQAILRLALPAIFGQVILVLYNLSDTFFIGLTGSDANLTAVTVCMPAFLWLSAVSNLFGVGGASEISRCLGRKEPERASAASGFSVSGCAGVTLLYSLAVFLFLDPVIDLLGGVHPEVHALCRSYLLTTVVLGGFGTAMNALLSHLVRAEGRSAAASAGIMGGGILNILLDPLFMFHLLPRGQEVFGAGLATALSNLSAMCYFLVILWRNRRCSVLRLFPGRERPDRELVLSILSVGLPACVMTLMENVSYAVLDNLLSSGGIAVQAGIGVAKKVNMLAHCTVRGLTQGVLPLIAYSFASGNHARMRQTVRYAAVAAVSMASLWTAFSLAAARPLIGLFIQNSGSSLENGVLFLRILCLGGPFSACAYTFISFFQAVGQGFRSFILALLRKGLVDIPLMIILSRRLPVAGPVAATPLADAFCCLCAVLLFREFLYMQRRTDAFPRLSPHRQTTWTGGAHR